MPTGIYKEKRDCKVEGKICLHCECSFKKGYKMSWKQFDKQLYCSKECVGNAKRGISVTYNTGKTWLKKGDTKGKNNTNWKGDDASYYAIHIWVKNNKGNPEKCIKCGKIGKVVGNKWNIDWSNIDHKYNRNLDDYQGLCHKCHCEYDIVLKAKAQNAN